MKRNSASGWVPRGRIFKNETKAPQIFYDSYMNPIIVKPGESIFLETMQKFGGLAHYAVDPNLWNKASEVVKVAESGGKIVVDLHHIDKAGDSLMLSILPKAIRAVASEETEIVVWVNNERCKEYWLNNPDVDRVVTVEESGDLVLDVNSLELKWREKWADKTLGYQSRSKVWLSNLGLHLIDRTPRLVLSEREKKWAEDQIKKLKRGKGIIAVQTEASTKSREVPAFKDVIKKLKAKGFTVIDLTAKVKGRYKYSFRQAAALASKADLLLVPDSSFRQRAGS